ncbi:MAG: efflux RND transporter periplasmic adaptor subunit [Bacteriovorax sp.]|nr:efflux RND transporter periplasmic adaptor subunit [Bacteriovorax sp.]
MSFIKNTKAKLKTVHKKQLLAIGVASTLILLLVYLNISQRENTTVKNFIEVTVSKQSINVESVSTGVIQPQNRLEVKSSISGRMEKILVKEGDFVHKNQIIAWMSSEDRAALLDAAYAKGKDERKKWEEIYPATPIMSPISGTVILKSFEEGQVFVWSDALFTVSDRLTVKAQVDETDISKIEKGQVAMITLDAYQDKVIKAYVDKIAYDATTINNVTTYIVDVVPMNAPKFIRSGMTASVRFHLVTKHNVLVIPSFSIKLIDGKNIVTVVNNGKKRNQEIKIGVTDGKKQEVIKGLSEGDVILVPDYHQSGENDQVNTNTLVTL